MNAPSPSTSIRFARRDWLLGAVFLALLLLPTLDFFFGIDPTPAVNENRNLAPAPVWSGVKNVQPTLVQSEKFFNDHFGFRRLLLWRYLRIKHKWFGSPPSADVIIGRDGWLYSAAESMVAHHIGALRFNPDDLRDWQTLLERRRDWLARRNIAFVTVVAPDKHSIYPEHLPEWLRGSPLPTKLDQLATYLAAHSTVRFVDLRQSLLTVRDREPLYYMTDTHWNPSGSFIGYQETMRSLMSINPAWQPMPDSAVSKTSAVYTGDLSILLGQQSDYPEKTAVTLAMIAPASLEIHHSREPFGGKTRAVTRVINPQAQGKVIVFHDSFGELWSEWIGQHFREAIFVSQRELDPAFIEEQKPQLVIIEMVERGVNTLNVPRVLDKEALEK
jgi:hypothetical protein